ncbi:MAG: ABC transporter ATP-binding protein [Candidatus Bathyarchaeota archaeon]|jgi:putative ABC transport system ATP-binding protein|nr:ABC transporter ATP-binding protein [Candidatus Bathyarchaeota archaeon A05DMB-5]MDH7557805.1 ABC transporter ATP-binding protein [Candidatus Bathyarchaeota archaeon]
MKTLLEAHDVKKAYRMGKVHVPALRGVSFEVKKDEFLTIFGPSGSGKSTLLHLIGGLDRPDEGKIIIDGFNILEMSGDKLAELRLTRIGFVFQFFNLLPRLTALRNVELPLSIAGVPEKEAVEKAKEMLTLVGLETRMNHKPTELSGGEQQRVAIARALINNPKIVLADEPTGNLDTKTGWEIVQLMKKLNEEKGQTFIVVTHDLHIAETADRIIHLKDGLIEAIKEAPRGNKR